MIVKGIIAAPAAISWLSTTKYARILCVFDRSCTLTRDDGKLISLVTADIGPGPFTMVIASRDEPLKMGVQSFSGIGVEAPVTVRNGFISLDWLSVDSRDVEIWNPQPDWPAVTAEILNENILVLKNLLKLHGPSGSLADLISGAELNQTQQLIRDVWSYLAKGLGELDLSKNEDQMSQIAGLGGGLTPAGDDFLLGMMMAIWCCVPVPKAQRVALDVANATVGRTTSLSSAWLEAAGKGEATQYWHEFIEALAGGDPSAIRRTGRRIIGIGHTSGADALTGFLLTGEILSKISLPGDGMS